MHWWSLINIRWSSSVSKTLSGKLFFNLCRNQKRKWNNNGEWLTKSDDCKARIRFVNQEYDYRQIWMTQFIITVTISGRNIENKNKDLQLRQSLKNSFMVAAMVNVINSVIGGCSWVDLAWLAASTVHYRCLITANCLIALSHYNCTEWLVKNKALNTLTKL